MLRTPEQSIVSLPAGRYVLTLGALPAGGSRFLDGAGARTTTITALNESGVMTVTPGDDVSVRDVTIADGNAPLGGGIHVPPSSALNLFDTMVEGNTAEVGGGIYSEGTLTVQSSTIAFNHASGATPRGGGVAIADGIATLNETTISSNDSELSGAGLYTEANVTLRGVTIAANEALGQAPSGGGIQQQFDGTDDNTLAFNTLVVENLGGNCLGTGVDPIDSRFSMSDDQLCNVVDATINFPIPPNTAGIGELGANGGPTDTHDVLASSPAVGSAEDGQCSGLDQRGLPRPQGIDGCDIGAYERAGTLVVTTTTDENGFCSEGGCSVREAIDLVARGGDVEIPPGAYLLPQGALQISRDVVVRGAGARVTTLRGAGARVLEVSGNAEATVFSVRITGGNATQPQPFGALFGGGVAVIDAFLHLVDSSVDDNVAGRGGGGIYTDIGGLRLTDTTVASNRATDPEFITFGGGLLLSDSFATMENSTISGNTAMGTGGGLMSVGTELDMVNVTIAANTLLSAQGQGSAIYGLTVPDGSIDRGQTLGRNVLVAGNPGTDCAGDAPFELTNTISDDASCPSQIVPDALIEGLAANDGDTDTHALLTGSPAINAGAGCPLADQRGISRPQGTACDVGAYELVMASLPSGGGGGAGTAQPASAGQQELPPPKPESTDWSVGDV